MAILVGQPSPLGREYTVTTSPVLVGGVYSLFTAAWEAATDLGACLRGEVPELAPGALIAPIFLIPLPGELVVLQGHHRHHQLRRRALPVHVLHGRGEQRVVLSQQLTKSGRSLLLGGVFPLIGGGVMLVLCTYGMTTEAGVVTGVALGILLRSSRSCSGAGPRA